MENKKNKSTTLDSIGIAVRYRGKVRDFPIQTNITIEKYSSKTFIFEKSFYEIGDHKFQPYISYKGNKYFLAFSDHFYVNSAISLTSFSFVPSNPKVGEEITFSTILKNNTSEAITLDFIGVTMKIIAITQ